MDDLTFADAFADRAHAGQVRKGGDIPYITHPREVSAVLVERYPDNRDLAVAGLLHDVVEDTPVKIETIDRLFGRTVGSLVWTVTNTRPGYTLVGGHPDALRLKAADLLANIIETQRDIEQGHYVWVRFATGRGKVDAWDHQTTVIERGLRIAEAAVINAREDDRDLVERLRARVEMMKGLSRIITDAERNYIADATREQLKPPPVELHG